MGVGLTSGGIVGSGAMVGSVNVGRLGSLPRLGAVRGCMPGTEPAEENVPDKVGVRIKLHQPAVGVPVGVARLSVFAVQCTGGVCLTPSHANIIVARQAKTATRAVNEF